VFVFLPACDEEDHIEELVAQLKQLKLNMKIHVIDDGSKDATAELARKAGAVVLRHPVNLGQWAAMRTAFTVSLMEDARVMVSVDADGQHDPRDLPKLLEPILTGSADIVVGSRFLNGEHPEMPLYRHAGIKVFNKLLELFTKKQLTDCTSGYKAYNMTLVRKILPNLRENQYGALEFIAEAARQRARITEAPIAARANDLSRKGKIRYGYNLLRSLLIRG
jgi:glycosyltransferase involved in cell wall biosynthesis